VEILGTSSEPPAASRLNVVSRGSGAPGNRLMKKQSIVIPVFSEAEGLQELSTRLKSALESLRFLSEILLVDDGRSDEIKKNLQA
jgi:hypothetical protein